MIGVGLGVQEERGERRRQALGAAAKDAKLTQVRRNMQALEAKLIQALQADAHRSASFRPCPAGIARGMDSMLDCSTYAVSLSHTQGRALQIVLVGVSFMLWWYSALVMYFTVLSTPLPGHVI